MTSPAEEPVLHALWAAVSPLESLDDDDCGPTKVCRNMRDFTFDDLPASVGADPGTDAAAAWRERLAREGKLGAGSLRDLLGP